MAGPAPSKLDRVGSATTNPTGRARSAPVPVPEPTRWAAEAFTTEHLGHLIDRRGSGHPTSSAVFRGGQRAADAALDAFDVAGYAAGHRWAYPVPRRAGSGLSPYLRHGLLSVGRVWDTVTGPDDDVAAFRAALLRLETARHRYAERAAQRRSSAERRRRRTGSHEPAGGGQDPGPARGWDRRMGCVDIALDELEEDGFLVDEARRWLAAQWVVELGNEPAPAAEHLFRHLLDGSRATATVGWAGADRYPFTRWEVEEWAPGLCASCELVHRCPIERPREEATPGHPVEAPPSPSEADGPAGSPTTQRAVIERGVVDVGVTGPAGALVVETVGPPEAVWLTAESLGDDDPALVAHPELPAVFVFDEPLLDRLRLSAKRLTFLVETLADLAIRRPVEIHIGDPIDALTGRRLATTFAPVPGWRTRAGRLDLAIVHPWPWFRRPAEDGTFDGDDGKGSLR